VAKISPINIPVTVDPTGMDRGIQTAEQKLRAASRRMERAAGGMAAGGGLGVQPGGAFRGVATAAAGPLGFGAAGGALGALGAGGFAIGAIAAPFLLASRMAESLAAATQGATEQLQKLQTEGVGGFGNAALLGALASREREAQARTQAPTLAQTFFGAERLAGGPGGEFSSSFMDIFGGAGATAAAKLGAVLSGSDVRTANDIAAIAAMPPGAESERAAAQLQVQQRSRQQLGYQGAMDAPLSFVADTLFESNFLFLRSIAEAGI
jgi:uncharacterized protein YceK